LLCDLDGVGLLLPHLAGVVVESVERLAGQVRIGVRPRAVGGRCARCGTESVRVHSRYRRCLADAAVGGQPVVVEIRIRRFFCDAVDCPVRTFAEQVEGLTTRHARRTPLLRGMLEAVGLALAGRAGARLAGRLGVPTGRSSMLRLVRALPDPAVGVVRVLGVDDFALRRGHVYGTVLVDMDTHRPVDLLGDREAGTLADWLRAHPGTQVVCRDRFGAYAEGARAGAPEAAQVADRWHLWHNLAGHVEKAVARHRGCLGEPPAAELEPEPDYGDETAEGAAAAVAVQRVEQTAVVIRTRARYAAVQELLAQGKRIKPIMRELGLAKETVRRFARATSVEDLLANARDGRPSILDEFKPYLHQRLNDGCTVVLQLVAEIRAQEYQGSYGAVRDYLRPFRRAGIAPPATPAPPKVGDVASWMLRHPDTLHDDEQLSLKQVLARCPHLDAAAGHVTAFAEMLTGRHGERLDAWIATVEADGQPDLHSFTTGLKRDHAAVTNGLTMEHSSGAVEGNVNRIKVYKRQMYGRAKLDLLRKRVLLAT
jgi:transposase